jgi:hypothetical protein
MIENELFWQSCNWIIMSCMWSDFLSLYFQFYEVIILGGTYATGEKKMQNVSLDVKLRL